MDSSAANAAVAAAVAAAAKAAEEAAAAADAWAETKRPTETAAPRGPPTDANDRPTNRDRAENTAEVSVVVSRGRTSARTFESGGGVSSTAKAVRASPSPDVARVQSLLDANPNDAVSAGDGIAAEYWTPIPESERAASSSFEESDDGGFAPTEWIQNIRKSRARAAGDDENARASAGAAATPEVMPTPAIALDAALVMVFLRLFIFPAAARP